MEIRGNQAHVQLCTEAQSPESAWAAQWTHLTKVTCASMWFPFGFLQIGLVFVLFCLLSVFEAEYWKQGPVHLLTLSSFSTSARCFLTASATVCFTKSWAWFLRDYSHMLLVKSWWLPVSCHYQLYLDYPFSFILKLWSYRSPKGFYDSGIIYRTSKRNDAGTAISSESVTFSMKTMHPWSNSSTPFALTLPFNLTG